jgi:hypothetical protein
MTPLLLILVLFSDPNGEGPAKIIGEELGRIGGQQVQVVIGPDAVKQLEQHGMGVQDLVVTPALGNHLTETEKKLVIIRVDRRIVGGDSIIESKVWSNGRTDSHVSIAGNGGDPLAGAVSGIIQVIGPKLPTQPDIAPSREDQEITQLADGKEWKLLAERLLAITTKDPRQYYYLIQAQAQLGHLEDARKNYGEMKSLFAGHFLTRAAETLVPSAGRAVTTEQKAPIEDKGGNVLRDTPAAPHDDTSNVLR